MSRATLDPRAAIGAVHLTVADLERSIAFYRERIGLRLASREGSVVRFRAGDRAPAGAGDGAPEDVARDLLVLTEIPGALRVPHATGLYHFAILVPSRRDLAQALRHLAQREQRFAGFADHLVSESLYLADPDGNGIEIYRDRPRAEWPREANGSYRLDNLPLDLDGLLGNGAGAAEADPWPGMPRGTRIGHVHLQVGDVKQTEAFYADVLGMDVTARYGKSASFLAAGGYHHHVGMNAWHSLGASAPPPGAAGLRHFEIVVSSVEERTRVADRIARAGGEIEEGAAGILARDPSGNGIALVAASEGA